MTNRRERTPSTMSLATVIGGWEFGELMRRLVACEYTKSSAACHDSNFHGVHYINNIKKCRTIK